MMRPVILSRPGKARLLVDDLLRRRLGDHLVARLQRGRRLRHALGLALSRRQSRQRIGAGRRDRDALAGLRRRDRDAGRRILRNDGGARRRRQRLRLHRSRRRHALPRRRTVRRRQQAALRQFRHFFFVVGLRLLVAAREYCRAAAAPDRKKYCRSAPAPAAQARSSWRQQGPQNRSGQWFETSRAALKGESGSRHCTDLSAARRAIRLTRRIRRGKGGLPPLRRTGQPAPQMK